MNNLKKFLLVISFFLFFISCEKNTLNEEVKIDLQTELNLKTEIFTKAFAKALVNKELRELIKTEAEKEFNSDYDILFQNIKNRQINGTTVISFISTYNDNKADLNSIVNEIPLLTIFVPHLKNFTVRTWDVDTQIPIVTYLPYDNSETSNSELIGFDFEGNTLKLEYIIEPSIPVLVIKENERLVINQTLKNVNTSSSFVNENYSLYKNIDGIDFYFLDKAFDKSANDKVSSPKICEENLNFKGGLKGIEGTYSFASWNSFDPTIKAAYEANSPCQRDNAYYNILPGNTTGIFRSNYSEFITSISVENSDALRYLTDSWTEGYLEFVFKIFFIDGNSGMTDITKNISCRTSDLYNASDGSMKLYVLPSPIEIVPFDLYRYGDTWKFVIYEYDANSTYSLNKSVSVSSRISGNVGVKDKWGLGVELSGSKTSSIGYTINNTSDALGEGVMYYTDPVVIKRFIASIYITKVISTGQLNLFVQPKKIY